MTARTAEEILGAAKTVLVVDWPSRDVPDTLARAGYEVVVHGGPAPDDYSAYVAAGGDVARVRTGQPPVQADLVYSYRPVAELAEILAMACELGATAVWVQLPAEDVEQARALVEAAGLAFVDGPYLPDAVRALGNRPS